jgi:sarcosine oxidase subunit beta
VSQTADVVIVGAGIIGGSVAFNLLERDTTLRVVVLEKEPEPGTGATSKATGGVRFQFSTEANVRLTQLSYRYFTHAEEILGSPVDFTRHGYLFVTTDPATLEQCRRNVALQRALGVGARS